VTSNLTLPNPIDLNLRLVGYLYTRIEDAASFYRCCLHIILMKLQPRLLSFRCRWQVRSGNVQACIAWLKWILTATMTRQSIAVAYIS